MTPDSLAFHAFHAFCLTRIRAEIAKLPEYGRQATEEYAAIFTLRDSKPGPQGAAELVKLLTGFAKVKSRLIRADLIGTAMLQLPACCLAQEVTAAVMELANGLRKYKGHLLLCLADSQARPLLHDDDDDDDDESYTDAHRHSAVENLMQKRSWLGPGQDGTFLDSIEELLRGCVDIPADLYLNVIEFFLSMDSMPSQSACAILVTKLRDCHLSAKLLKGPDARLDWFHSLLLRFASESRPVEDLDVRDARWIVCELMIDAASSPEQAQAFVRLWRDLWSLICERMSAALASLQGAVEACELMLPFIAALVQTRPEAIELKAFLEEALKWLPSSQHGAYLDLFRPALPLCSHGDFARVERHCQALPSASQCQLWSAVMDAALSGNRCRPAYLEEAMQWARQSQCYRAHKAEFLCALARMAWLRHLGPDMLKLILQEGSGLPSLPKAALLNTMLDGLANYIPCWEDHAFFLYPMCVDILTFVKSSSLPDQDRAEALDKLECFIDTWPEEEAELKRELKQMIADADFRTCSLQ